MMFAVQDLGFHRMPGRLVEQGIRVAGHDQLGHQVLEHRAAPRQQCRVSVDLGQQAAQREPALLRQLPLRDRHEAAQACFRRKQVVEPVVQAVFVHVVADHQQVACAVIEELVFHQRELPGDVREAFELMDPFPCAPGRQRACGTMLQVTQRRQAITGPCVGIGQQELQLRMRRPAALDERGRPVMGMDPVWTDGGPGRDDALRMHDQARQHAFRIGDGRWRRPLCLHQHGAELDHRQRRCVAVGLRVLECILQHGQGVGQPRERRGRQDRGIGQRQQALAQGQQVPGKVAAVHRGNIGRRQRLQGLGVVPVVEVPTMARQRIQCVEHQAATLHHATDLQVAEIVGRQVGQQRQPDVGRRGASRHHQRGMLLHVVGRKPVILRAYVSFEEGPRPA